VKLITWNIYRRNKRLEQLPAFIDKLDADVLCLQEVPLNAMDIVASTYPHMVACREFEPHKKRMETQLVILSKHPIETHTRVEHGNPPAASPAARWSGKCEGKEFHFVDLTIGETDLRIFNVHLPLKVPPSFRLAELDYLRKYIAPDRQNFICGDMNSFGGPFVNPSWGWYYGYSKKDYFIHERKHIERMMAAHELINPFSGKRTHQLLNIQLDYILLPKSAPLMTHEIIRQLGGSDHYPLAVRVAL